MNLIYPEKLFSVAEFAEERAIGGTSLSNTQPLEGLGVTDRPPIDIISLKNEP